MKRKIYFIIANSYQSFKQTCREQHWPVGQGPGGGSGITTVLINDQHHPIGYTISEDCLFLGHGWKQVWTKKFIDSIRPNCENGIFRPKRLRESVEVIWVRKLGA